MDLKKKVGPLPVYAWAGIATVAILAAYFYLHRGSSAAADSAGLVTPDTGGAALDPTTGMPYSGSGFQGGGSEISPTAADPAPTLSTEIDDVSALITSLTGAGFLNAGQGANSYDDQPVWNAIAGLQASTQLPSDHSSPPSPAQRDATFTAPSAKHGGALWTYRRGADGKPIPVAAVTTTGTTSGAHSAPADGHASSGALLSSHPQKTTGSQVRIASGTWHDVGSVVQKNGKNYKVNSNGSLRPA